MSELSDELLSGVQAFLVQRLDHATRLAILEGRESGASLLAVAAEEGWFNLLMPESEGGMGVTPSDLIPGFQALGQNLATSPFFEHMFLPALLVTGLELEPRILERLARVIRGEARLAFADTKVSLDWSLGRVIECRGRLAGEVAMVRFGAAADLLLVMAQDEAGQACLVMIDARAPGVGLTGVPSADPGMEFARLQCDGTRIETHDVIARGEDAERIARTIRAWARISMAAELTGIARRALDLALSYIGQRKQFGKPVASFQSVRHLAASAAQRVIELECFAEMIVQDASSLGDADLETAAMSYKAAAAELARGVVEDAIQMHGGIAFTYEYELQWYYKRCMALRAWYGDETELYRAIGRARLALDEPPTPFRNDTVAVPQGDGIAERRCGKDA